MTVPLKPDAVARFWHSVKKTPDCWEWTGYCLNRRWSGYGILNMDKKQYRAHRFSWLLHFGHIPNGQCVLHRCDNPKCVRPDHLFLGSRADNNLDRDNKGRSGIVFGQKNGMAKLTAAQVLGIREYLRLGKSLADIARLYGVRWQTIQAIKDGVTWKHA